jgi:hypothetical protein
MCAGIVRAEKALIRAALRYGGLEGDRDDYLALVRAVERLKVERAKARQTRRVR